MEPEPCIDYSEHPSFTREMGKFLKKHHDDVAMRHLKSLLSTQFHPVRQLRKEVLSEKVLRRISNLGVNIEVYKVNLSVKGISSGQSPRVCFWVLGNQIVFLCFGSHIENYRDDELKESVKARLKELNSELVFT